MVNPNHTRIALAKGLIDSALIDTRVGNLFRLRMRLGLFDKEPNPLDAINNDTVCSKESQELSRDGVRQGVTLLKNVDKRLPLAASAIKTAAVFGPM